MIDGMSAFTYLTCSIAGYLVGSFPTGVVLSKKKYGIDVREMGSGNIGATNVTRVFGWYAGVLVFLADFLKGYVPLWVTQKLIPDSPWCLTIVGAMVVLGHCYSLFLRFRGGKGVATSLGCLFMVAPWACVAASLVYIVSLALTRISAIGSLAGVVASFIYIGVSKPEPHVTVLILWVGLIIIVRHQSNIRRLWAGFSTGKGK